MIADLHTHILPGIDDGAADLTESLALLAQEQENGAEAVLLTPHFEPQRHDPARFLRAREEAAEKLFAAEDTGLDLIVGAEVLYSPYLANLESIREFCIAGTDYLLLEMPYHAKFDDKVLQAVSRLQDEYAIIPILAHVERYEAVRRNVGILADFREFGCLFQVNADSILSKNLGMKSFIRSLVREDYLNLLGSDCHDPKSRPVRLKDAMEHLSAQYSEQVVRKIRAMTQTVIDNKRW